MKRFCLLLLVLSSLVSCSHEGWTLIQEGSGKSWPASVPSTVAGVLLDNGEDISSLDPEGTWTYRWRFCADPAVEHTLRFDGIGYRADITLNGTLIASSDTTLGVFAVREYDVSGLIRKRNVLDVCLQGARPGDLNIGWVDWNPSPAGNSMGLVRDVTLIPHGAVHIKDLYVHPVLDGDLTGADIEVRALLCNRSDKPVEVALKGETDGQEFSRTVSLEAGQKKEEIFTAVHIDSPRLWWTWDLGSPELYSLSLEASVDGEPSESASRTYGIRRLTSRLDSKGHRLYSLNGRDLLILGAGWADEQYLRDSHESLEHQISLVKGANLNCIRFENIWGKDSYIYDLCDREGILAITGWSCQWEWESYCGIPHDMKYGCINDPAHNSLAYRYFQDQMRWLRNHPCIAAFLTGSDRIANPQLEPLYIEEFRNLGLEFSYICSASAMASMAGPSGNKMTGPYEYAGPEYWMDERAAGGADGFNTETGIGLNMPQIESVRTILPAGGLWPAGEEWDRLCTVAAEGMHDISVIKEVVAGQYGEPSTLEQFVSRAHAADYTGTRGMYEAFRINRGKATGVVQWMLNSACPMLYWQLYDWYGIPTAGYYGTRKACTPIQVLCNWGDRTLWAVNGTAQDASMDFNVRIFDASSREILSGAFSMKVPSGASSKVMELPVDQDIFVFIEGDADNSYAVPAKGNIHDWEHSSWFRTPISRYADLSYVTSLPEASLNVSREGEQVTVENCSDTVAFQIVLKSINPDGSLEKEALWSDNFFSLPPMSKKTVTCTGKGEIAYTYGI